MNEKELLANIDKEIQWLKYYALAEYRAKLNLNDGISLYDQLVSIGYTKRVIALDKRCAFLRVTSKDPITINTTLSDLEEIVEYRDNSRNIFTALEYYIIANPHLREDIFNRLN